MPNKLLHTHCLRMTVWKGTKLLGHELLNSLPAGYMDELYLKLFLNATEENVKKNCDYASKKVFF